jgi:hypothetical protein
MMAKPELKTDSFTAMRAELMTAPFMLRAELRELSSADFEVLLKAVVSEHLFRNKSLQDGFGMWTGT